MPESFSNSGGLMMRFVHRLLQERFENQSCNELGAVLVLVLREGAAAERHEGRAADESRQGLNPFKSIRSNQQ